MSKILVDTNVFIYALEKSSKYYTKAVSLLTNKDYTLITSTKNISEYFAVTTKLKLHPENIDGFYAEIKRNIEILYPSELSLRHFEELVNKYSPVGNMVYDIEVASVMLANSIPK